MKGDLHIHTDVSDGARSPSAVAGMAVAGGLDFIAVTDHNSLAGIGEAAAVLDGQHAQLICGVELTAQPDDGGEIHILGYGFDPESPQLNELCLEICRRKREQIDRMMSRLQRDGVAVDRELFDSEPEDRYNGRPVLAGWLLEQGVVGSIGQAFARYLGSRGRAFVPMEAMDPAHCIEAIHEAGGVAVLAHPRIDTVDEWLAALVQYGLDGVELFRPALRGNEQLYVEKAAEHFGLATTGGSDWHGRPSEPPLGAFAVARDQMNGFFRILDGCHSCPPS